MSESAAAASTSEVEAPPRRARVYLVLPAFDEELDLEALLESAHSELVALALDHLIVVVDDGSTDGTPRILAARSEDLPLVVVTHEVNLGLGTTIRDGLRHAAELCERDDVVVTMDADNSHPVSPLGPLVDEIRAGADLAIASRFRTGAGVRGVPRHRQVLSLGARFLFQLVFPLPGVRDYTCGYRAFRGALLHEAFRRHGESLVTASGFHGMAELLLNVATLEPRVVELPLELRYDAKRGTSKMRVGSTVVRTLQLLVRKKLGR